MCYEQDVAQYDAHIAKRLCLKSQCAEILFQKRLASVRRKSRLAAPSYCRSWHFIAAWTFTARPRLRLPPAQETEQGDHSSQSLLQKAFSSCENRGFKNTISSRTMATLATFVWNNSSARVVNGLAKQLSTGSLRRDPLGTCSLEQALCCL